MGFGNFGVWEIILILIVILIIFGPGKLPEVGKAIGKALRSFKNATKGIEEDDEKKEKELEEKKQNNN